MKSGFTIFLLALSLHAAAAPPPPAASPTQRTEPAADAFAHFRVGNKNVKSLLLEGDVLWVGTSGGLIRYDTKGAGFRLYDHQSGLLSNGVFHVGRVNGHIAVGTYGGGLSLLHEKTGEWESYNIPEGLGDAFVYDMLEASNGDLWIATWSGVNRVKGGRLRDPSSWELHTVASTRGGLINDWVYGLAEGAGGVIWMATEGGVVKYHEGKWENWNHARGLGADYEAVKDDIQFRSDPSKASQHHARQKQEMGLEGVDVAYNPNYVIALAVDRDGVVWAGTWGGGLSRYDGRAWKSYTTRDGLPGNHVSMLHVSPSGELWIGTNRGLAQLHGDKFVRLGREEGLFADIVFSMASAPGGDIWVGSFGGVAHVRAPKLK